MMTTTRAGQESIPSDSRLRQVFSLDVRSLALFRILIGLVLLLDLLWRLPLISAFYTDAGLLPRVEAFRKMRDSWAVSLHLISGEWWVQFGLFAIAILFAIGLLLGYRTRLCTVCSWLLFSSMHVRDPFVQYFADLVLQALLFWAMFLPLNARWSVDAALNRDSEPLEMAHFSWATQAYILQICFIYWFTAAMKWDPSWLKDGTAVYYALSLDFSVRPLGKLLLQFPGLLRVLTRATMGLEFVGPFLLLSPWWNDRLRLLAVLLFVGFHASLALTMDLTGFSLVCIVGWLALIPGGAWAWIEGRSRTGVISRRWAELQLCFEGWATRQRRRSEWLKGALTPPAPHGNLGLLSRTLVLGALLVVFATSVSNVPASGVRLPPFWVNLASSSQLNQMWAMYAGPPFLTDGWYVFDGVLMDGRHVDIWRGKGQPTTAKPADVPATYRSPQWRAYLLRLANERYQPYRVYFGRYLCRTWNEGHTGGDRLNLLYINFMLEKTVPPGQMQPPASKQLVSRHYCFQKPADW